MADKPSMMEQITESGGDRSDLTPMIDVIFLLLLFFILTTTFAEETFFPIELPDAEKAEVSTLDEPVILEINKDGQFAINKNPLPSLRAVIAQMMDWKSKGRDLRVVVKADRECSMEVIAAVAEAFNGLDIPLELNAKKDV